MDTITKEDYYNWLKEERDSVLKSLMKSAFRMYFEREKERLEKIKLEQETKETD